jgi:uncharacterized protein YndB with AHSA1/START domain
MKLVWQAFTKKDDIGLYQTTTHEALWHVVTRENDFFAVGTWRLTFNTTCRSKVTVTFH